MSDNPNSNTAVTVALITGIFAVIVAIVGGVSQNGELWRELFGSRSPASSAPDSESSGAIGEGPLKPTFPGEPSSTPPSSDPAGQSLNPGAPAPPSAAAPGASPSIDIEKAAPAQKPPPSEGRETIVENGEQLVACDERFTAKVALLLADAGNKALLIYDDGRKSELRIGDEIMIGDCKIKFISFRRYADERFKARFLIFLKEI